MNEKAKTDAHRGAVDADRTRRVREFESKSVYRANGDPSTCAPAKI